MKRQPDIILVDTANSFYGLTLSFKTAIKQQNFSLSTCTKLSEISIFIGLGKHAMQCAIAFRG